MALRQGPWRDSINAALRAGGTAPMAALLAEKKAAPIAGKQAIPTWVSCSGRSNVEAL